MKPQVKRLGADCPAPPPRQRHVRLSGQQQLELVDTERAPFSGSWPRYMALSAGTVGEIVKRHGAKLQRGLSLNQINDAVRRYESGESLARVGEALGVTAHTVRSKLLARGVKMRDTHGASRGA